VTRRRRRLLLGAAAAVFAAGVAAAVVIAGRGGSGGPEQIRRAARNVRGTVRLVGQVTLETSRRLPPLTRANLRHFLEEGLNEAQGRLTPVRASERLLRSADFPATRLGPALPGQRVTVVDRGRALFIAEPDVAAHGERVLVTWNDGAAFSSDGGRTFEFVDPARTFPRAHDGFCCDQRVLYVPGADLWVWVLQYWPDETGNVQRVAIARGDAGFDNRDFRIFDLAPGGFAPTPERRPDFHELDYPDIAATRAHLFLSSNVFDEGGDYTGTVVVRLPIAQLAAGTRPDVRIVQNRLDAAVFAGGDPDTMYFTQHVDSSRLRVWSWPDAAASPTSADVDHTRYAYGSFGGYSCPRQGAQGGDWCERLTDGKSFNDDRGTAGWVAGDTIGFAWNAQRDPANGFPYPYVMVVRLDRSSLKLMDEPFIWSPDHAYEYAAIAGADGGEVGGVLLAGGGSRYQACAVLSGRVPDGSSGGWNVSLVDESDSDPSESTSGDYLGAKPGGPEGTWVGSCMTVHGGRDDRNVEIRFVSFGG
jgi:hypothetical protein